MARIFLAYARDDQPAAMLVARELERAGFSLWRDEPLPPGRSRDEAVAAAIDACDAALVFWSAKALASTELKDDAVIALAAQKYLPVALDDTEPPVAFRRIHACDLKGWSGEADAPRFQVLLQTLRARVPAAPAPAVAQAPALAQPSPPMAQDFPQFSAPAQTSAASAQKRRWMTLVLAGLGVVTALCVALLLWRESSEGAVRRVEADRASWAQIDTQDRYAVRAFRDHAQSRQYRELASQRLTQLSASGATPPAPQQDANAPPPADPLAGNWNFTSSAFDCGDAACTLQGRMSITPSGAGAYTCSFTINQFEGDKSSSAEESCTLTRRTDGRIAIASNVVSSTSDAWVADYFTLRQTAPDVMSGITHDGRQTASGIPVRFTR